MTTPKPSLPGAAESMDGAILAELGVLRIATERFDVGPYRYTNLADALAEAKRVQTASLTA